MAHPIVFISHFTIKPGKLDETIRSAATAAGVPLTIQRGYLAGFVRLSAG